MPAKHVYAPIAALHPKATAGRCGQCVELEGGVSFCLPVYNYSDFEAMRAGDMVLIDLHHWVGNAKLAHVVVYRRRADGDPNEVTRFSIGVPFMLTMPE